VTVEPAAVVDTVGDGVEVELVTFVAEVSVVDDGEFHVVGSQVTLEKLEVESMMGRWDVGRVQTWWYGHMPYLPTHQTVDMGKNPRRV
jgi:hypothetical protein